MSVLILSDRFKQQPQCNTPLDPYWLGRGLVVACNPAVGAINQVEKYKRYTVTNSGGLLTTVTQTGRSWKGETSKYVDFGSGYAATAGVTVIQIVNPGASAGFTFTSRASVGSDGLELLVGAASTPGDTQARMAASNLTTPTISGLHDNKNHVVAIRWTPSAELAIWSDRVASKKAVTSSVPSTLTATQNLRLHRRGTDGAYAGYSGSFFYFDRPLSDPEIAALLENPNIVYQARRRKLWAASPGVTTHVLTASNATQVNTSSTAAVTQAHLLAGANSAQANANATGAVTQTHIITVQTSAQPNTASAGAITQAHALGGASGTQPNTGTAGAVSQTHALSAAGSVQANAASTGAIATGATHNLAAAAATQANIGTPGAISQVHALVGAGGTQINTSTAGQVSQSHVLSAAGSAQANAASVGAVTVGVVHDLAVSPSTQANAGATGAISQAHVLVCPASVQDNIADASAIVQAHILSGSESGQNNLASSGAILLGDRTISSTVERAAVFRVAVDRAATFQRSKQVNVRFN